MKWFCIKRSQYFSKPYELLGRDINVKVDLSNYARETYLKNEAGIGTSKLATKSNLGRIQLKAEIDKLDIGKLVPAPVDLSKRSDVVKMILLKKKMCMTNQLLN